VKSSNIYFGSLYAALQLKLNFDCSGEGRTPDQYFIFTRLDRINKRSKRKERKQPPPLKYRVTLLQKVLEKGRAISSYTKAPLFIFLDIHFAWGNQWEVP
jgi:hypothetical protein